MATDSIQDQDPRDDAPKKQKSRKPGNTAFRQQRLKAWQPILTPKTVLPIFFAVGIIFAPIGGLLLWASATVQELSIDYTTCVGNATNDFQPIPNDVDVFSSFKSKNATSRPSWKKNTTNVHPPYSVPLTAQVCSLQFTLPNDIGPPVYLYYRLTNFYQNHRRYVKSVDTDQLRGQALDNGTIGGSACDPLKLAPNGKAYYPCGLIANSIFNDTITSPTLVNSAAGQTGETFVMTNKGIAWSSDGAIFGTTQYTPDQVEPPPNWAVRYPNGYNNNDSRIPDLHTYEELQVWMRTAGLPTFSKLSLRNDDDVMRAGTYNLDIYDFFPVQVYGGTKTVFISTRTVMGGKNSFLGIAYVVVGGICVVLGVFFTLAHLFKPRKLGDHTYLSWNNTDSQPTAVASGREARPGTQHA